jgi:hypothetical protein
MHRIRSRSVRLLLVPALTVPFVLAAVLALPGAASAKSSGPKGKITCTGMNGTETGTITISGCSGTAVPGTGGASKPLTVASLATGGPVTWVNNNVTVFGAAALNTSGKPKHCPGYVKPPKGSTTTPPEPSLIKFSGTVSSDNTGLKIPGKFKGEVCVSTSGVITAAKPLKVS